MKKKNKYLVIVMLMAFLYTGCAKWLDLKPESGLTSADYWKTKEQVKAMVVSCYQSMMTGSSPRNVVELLFLWGEMRADMITPDARAKSDEVLAMNGYITQDLSLCNWAPLYKTINLCNTVIQLAPGVLKTDPSFTQEALNGYLSEAYGIRALMYYYLVRTFGEVPLKLDATLTDEVNLAIPKSPANLIMNQIVSDLKQAEQMSVTSYGLTQDDKGRITKYAINAIQADVYLWREQYDSCLLACNKIINSGQYGLIRNYSSLFMSGQTNESIFELVFDEQLLNPFYGMFDPTNGRRFIAAQRVVDDIYTVDLLNSDNKDYRGDRASLRFSNLSIWKYLGLSGTTERDASQSYAPWIFYRYADVLLMKAEAEAQQNDLTSSLAIVYDIRSRANALENTLSTDTVTTEGVTDFILAERAREFAFEGKRWYDVLRNAKRNKYKRMDILTNLVITVAPENRVGIMSNNILDTLSHYLPIYTNELLTDTALVQNQFYKTN
ncbi:MAG TPA: RagB/SusD family nutrient uptake outer membrane protein [Bacteroidales bacterium]